MRKWLIGAIGSVILAVSVLQPAALPAGGDQIATAAPAMGWRSDPARLDTAAAAMPSTARPTVTDTARADQRWWGNGGHAIASAVATSNCDGCQAHAIVFQTVHLPGTGAEADNSAAAWSSCVGCGSTAVSFQLVIARRAAPLSVNNRALALNVTCEGCTTTAVAVQLVLVDPPRELSASATATIEQLLSQLTDGMSAQRSRQDGLRMQDARSLATEAATQVGRVVAGDLGISAVTPSVDVTTG